MEYRLRVDWSARDCDKEKLSDTVEHLGPPLSSKTDVDKFREKYEKTKTKGNRIYTIIKRKYVVPEKLLKDLFEEKYIFERVREISIEKIL